MIKLNCLALAIIAASCLTACGNSGVDESSARKEKAEAARLAQASPKPDAGFESTARKPGSPFQVSYNVIGKPIVGSPVTVNLRVSSTLGPRPVTVSYRINDATALMFNEAQPAKVEIAPAANEDHVAQQVILIPQREGRHYLNVSTSVETDSGSMSSVIAIPIQVGEGGRVLEEQGEVVIDEDGQAIRVLPGD